MSILPIHLFPKAETKCGISTDNNAFLTVEEKDIITSVNILYLM